MLATAEITKHEARDLTVALGAVSSPYPELFGTIRYMNEAGLGIRGLEWQREALETNPDYYDQMITGQVEKYSELIAPLIGKRAVAKSLRVAIPDEGEEWKELKTEFPNDAPHFTHGVIEGVREQITRTDLGGFIYRIGVEFDLSVDGYISLTLPQSHPQPPRAERALVTPVYFPPTLEAFDGLTSQQIQPYGA